MRLIAFAMVVEVVVAVNCVMVVVWGFVVWGVWGMGVLRCGRIALQGSCFVGEQQGGGVAVWGRQGVRKW